uniref:Uncharacterized protein n=1 Tax=Romanomermis culicivorax TaxID=13658 RepID=A0A915I404_ROMCU
MKRDRTSIEPIEQNYEACSLTLPWVPYCRPTFKARKSNCKAGDGQAQTICIEPERHKKESFW